MNNLFTIDGQIWVKKEERNFIGKGRIELLSNIEIYGSISKAAKYMKMSYKAAWDSIDIMNKLSNKTLVTRVTGGKGGGGSVLTSIAKELIHNFNEIQTLNENYLKILEQSFNENIDEEKEIPPSFTRLKAHISNLSLINSNYEIEITLESKQKLFSINSKDFVEKKLLKINQEINFLVETSAIIIHKQKNKSSARNILEAVIIAINDDGINTNLTLLCKHKDTIHAKITSASCKKLALKENDLVYAQFKAYNISIM